MPTATLLSPTATVRVALPTLLPAGAGAAGAREQGVQALFAPLSGPGLQLAEARVKVITEAPTTMGVGASLPVTISVEPSKGEAATIRDALRAYGVTTLRASLEGPSFSFAPADPQESPWLSEPKLGWTWVASASTPGTQTMRVSLKARGKPEWSDEPVEGEIWSGLVQVNVEGNAGGGFDLGRLDLTATINTLAGLGLTFPWIFEQIRKRVRRRQQVGEGEGAGTANSSEPEQAG